MNGFPEVQMLGDVQDASPSIGISPEELKKQKHRERSRKWRAEHRERVYEYNKKWRAEHLEKDRKRIAAWRAKHPERLHELEIKQRAKHRERIYERRRKWYATHREKAHEIVKKWLVAHPEQVKTYHHKRRTRISDAGGSFTAEDIKEMLKRQRGKCIVCGMDIRKNYHIDHIVPVSRGGSSNPNNLQLLCPRCNLTKHNKDNIEFMQQMGFLI
jgi:5-methylcytosine-specific restriction endonuclease McrA